MVTRLNLIACSLSGPCSGADEQDATTCCGNPKWGASSGPSSGWPVILRRHRLGIQKGANQQAGEIYFYLNNCQCKWTSALDRRQSDEQAEGGRRWLTHYGQRRRPLQCCARPTFGCAFVPFLNCAFRTGSGQNKKFRRRRCRPGGSNLAPINKSIVFLCIY